jgi:hypothetical protein
MENLAPYAIAGNNGNDYNKWNITPGQYTVKATPYSGSNGTGTAGTPITINITIIKSATALSGLTLINAATDKVIAPLVDGMVIDLASTPSINIRANPAQGATVKSVRFGLNSTTTYQMENLAPYAIAGNNGNDYNKWNITPGQYTVKATPYTGTNGGGAAGPTVMVTIYIVNSSNTQVQQQVPDQKVAAEGGAAISLWAYPNPLISQGFVEFRVSRTTQTDVVVVDMTGRRVEQVFSGTAEAGVLYKRELRLQTLASGVYLVRLITAEGKQLTQQIIVQ